LYSPEKNFFVAIFKCIFLPQKVIIDNRGDFQGRVKKAELGACAKISPASQLECWHGIFQNSLSAYGHAQAGTIPIFQASGISGVIKNTIFKSCRNPVTLKYITRQYFFWYRIS